MQCPVVSTDHATGAQSLVVGDALDGHEGDGRREEAFDEVPSQLALDRIELRCG